MDGRTTIFDVRELREELINLTINEVIEALEYKGYNAINQLVGYLKTGDDKYITSFNNSREKIKKYDRSELLMAILNKYVGK